MLELVIKDDTQTYGTLKLEHSLVAIAKWEAIYHKSFLSTKEKSATEMLEYIRCMTINSNVGLDVYAHLSLEDLNAIKDYISDRHTATTFGKSWMDEVKEEEDRKRGRKEEIITAELVYYWMIANNIPVEFQKWHIERLLALIRVCAIKNKPPEDKKAKRKRLSAENQQSLLAKRQALNAERKAKLGTSG